MNHKNSELYTLSIPYDADITITKADTPSFDGKNLYLGRNANTVDAVTFRALRDRIGAWIETQNEIETRKMIGLDDGESLGLAVEGEA